MPWSPHNLFHCIDSDGLAWLVIVECLLVVVLYAIITKFAWLPAARDATAAARNALYWMATLFLFCAVAGYGLRALSAFAPRWAFALLPLSLLGVLLSGIWFLVSRRGHTFRLIGAQQKAGAEILSYLQWADEKDPRMAEVIRGLMATKRQKQTP